MKIMLEPNISKEEREQKLEKLAENDILKIQELNKLEQDQKNLFGFDLSNYIHNKNVQNAENYWVTPDCISNLTNTFLIDYLGDSEYTRNNKEKRYSTLRLSEEKRNKLLEHLKQAYQYIVHDKPIPSDIPNKEAIEEFIRNMEPEEKKLLEGSEVTKAKLDGTGKKVTEKATSKNGKEYLKVVKEETTEKRQKDMPSRLNARRKMMRMINKVKDSEGNNVDLTAKLFNEIAPKYEGRNGGYTRMIKKGPRRGDAAEVVILALV